MSCIGARRVGLPAASLCPVNPARANVPMRFMDAKPSGRGQSPPRVLALLEGRITRKT